MIITELDKVWCRATTAKLIRQGKLKRQPCEVCGAKETLVHHIDYSDPEHIRWLCKRHKSEESMLALQRSLLARGLVAYYYQRPLAVACDLPHPGSFKLGSLITDFDDRRERASRRAATGLSIARLIRRRLLECCTRARWRLTPAGLKVARRLYADIKPPTKRQVAGAIALRKMISQWEDAHPKLSGKRRRRRSRYHAGTANADFEKVSPGVEVKLDLSGL
jgi:hypothetical protein